jgi:serine/threonine protein kinase
MHLQFRNFKSLKFVEDISLLYQPGRMLGKGSFGEVLAATHKLTGNQCAIKVVKKSNINGS